MKIFNIINVLGHDAEARHVATTEYYLMPHMEYRFEIDQTETFRVVKFPKLPHGILAENGADIDLEDTKNTGLQSLIDYVKEIEADNG